MFEEAAEVFEDTAREVVVPFFLEEAFEDIEAEDEADGFLGVAAEVGTEAVEGAEARDEDAFAEFLEGGGAAQKVLVGHFADGGEEVIDGELHEFDPWGFGRAELASEFGRCAGEHVRVDEGGWVEAAAEDEDWFFVEAFTDLHDFAFCGEESGVGEAALDELKGDFAVIDGGEVRAVEFEHVDFD